MNYQNLLADTAAYIDEYLQKKDTSKLCFHDCTHTGDVVNAAQVFINHYQLEEREATIVKVAAYFHDIGYCDTGFINHESKSASLAEDFLKNKELDTDFIKTVKGCIMATKMPQSPNNLLEQIICDSDLFHFGQDNFLERDKLMRKELEINGVKFDKKQWREKTIQLMENHHYHTSYGKEFLEPKKLENINILKQKQEAAILKSEDKPKLTEEEKDKKDKKDKRPDRGIETMFRITSTNNQRLSDMADNKSNILITVNSIILSVVIALLLRKLDNNAHLIFPTAILLCVSLATMVIAILATRPSIPNGYYNPEDVKQKKVNLLFFGNFHKMSLESYTHGMTQLMEDREYLYNTLIKDVYSQGVVLGRKFKLLRLAYSIFMWGLIISVLTFLIVVYVNR